MPPQTLPTSAWNALDDRVRYVLETYHEALTLLTETTFDQRRAPLLFGLLSHLADVLTEPLEPEEESRILSTIEVRFGRRQVWRAMERIERDCARELSAKCDPSELPNAPLLRAERALAEAELALWPRPLETILTEPHQSLLIVEGGAVPTTAILIAEKTGCAVTCLEADEEDAELARRFLTKCEKTKDKIRVCRGDPATYDFAPHPAILLANAAANKRAILERIHQESPLHQIAVRSAVGLNTLLYEPLEEQLEAALFLPFTRRTAAVQGCPKTTYVTALPGEELIFEKEEPKPELADVKYFPPHTHTAG